MANLNGISRKTAPNQAAPLQTSMSRAYEVCVHKTRDNIKRLADAPKSAAWALDGNYFNFKEGFYEIGNWTSSFFTGMALLAWRSTGDEYFLEQVRRLAPNYMEKVFMQHRNTHHDLGFLYSLYSVALYKLTRDIVHHGTGLRAAEVLSRRFNSQGGFIRAWGRMDTDEHANMAIIDCLMNLPLLYWAAKESRTGRYYDIAVRHADMVLKYFIRPDDSVYHAYRFDLKTGEPLGPENFCGRSVDSHWARGTAWAIYGFSLSYGYTQDKKYLDAAIRLAKSFAALLDDEVVPVWDFRLPAGVEPVRDSSAAAVAVCGIQDLARHNAADSDLLQIKDAMLSRICSEDYLDFSKNCPGILKSAYGDKPAYSSWGDYFLMEALDGELHKNPTWW